MNENENRSLNVFSEWNIKPFAALEGEKVSKETLWMGIELEVEKRDKVKSNFYTEVKNLVKDFAVVKGDGSLGNDGLEIVSIPGTLLFHRECWNDFLTVAHEFMKGWRGYNCGTHIHLSRVAMSDETLGKMMVFVHHPNNQTFISSVGGRGETQYNLRGRKSFDEVQRAISRKFSNHFDAFSISGSTGKTVELRIFRSNVAKDGFLKNVDFAHALKFFCDFHTSDQLNEKYFVNWATNSENQEKYPYLTKWMIREGYFNKEY